MESKICNICKSGLDDPFQFGTFMEKSGIRVHYHCLLLATNLPQKGVDSSGILGFLISDIKKEIKNAAFRICHYCGKENASIKCDKCPAYFHIICGLENDCLVQYIDFFKSFCHEHHDISHEKKHSSSDGCFICLGVMGPYNPVTSITATCCSSGTWWVHRKCIQKYAITAGYYLLCLWCRSPQFRDEVRRLGVFVPDRDAEWEREKGAFKSLYMTHATCDAVICFCTRGRDFKDRRHWKILLCYSCGISGIHLGCCTQSSHLVENIFQCSICHDIFNRTVQQGSQPVTKNSTQLDRTLFISKSQKAYYETECFEETVSTALVSTPELSEGTLDETPLPAKSVDPQDSDVLAYDALESLKDNSIIKLGGSRQELLSSTSESEIQPFDGLYGFDAQSIELIHKLVAQVEEEHLLHDEVIDVSDDDDGTQSVDDLLGRMAQRSGACVPKPCEK